MMHRIEAVNQIESIWNGMGYWRGLMLADIRDI